MGPWDHWQAISLRASIDTCEHGRPDHQIMIRQLAMALGLDEIPALPMSPERVWNGLLDEVEHLARSARRSAEALR